MKTIPNVIFCVLSLTTGSGCVPTYQSISGTPMQLQDGSYAYRYQGRANFPHQIAVSDKAMLDHCAKVSGGRPVIVDHQIKNVGYGGIAQTTSNTSVSGRAQPSGAGVSVYGSGLTRGTTTGGLMANQNQEIWFRCSRE